MAIADQLLTWQPDVIGLCEFRGTPASRALAERLAGNGWPHQINTTAPHAPARNALLLASRWPLRRRHIRGMPVLRDRWLLAHVAAPDPFTMGVMHAPNYTAPNLKYPMLDAVLDIAARWRFGPALVGGDTNAGLRHLDEENPLGHPSPVSTPLSTGWTRAGGPMPFATCMEKSANTHGIPIAITGSGSTIPSRAII